MMFLDESGNHDLNPRRINPNYPVFVLGGVIVDRVHVRESIEPAMREFKRRHFGRDDIVLHTVEMGKGRGHYGFLADPRLRTNFYADLNALLSQWDYTIVACAIQLHRYIAQFGKPADPYHFGLHILIERFCSELEDSIDAGFICAEKRNAELDRKLMAAWEELISNGVGTGGVDSREITEKVIDLSLKDKKLNLVGLQLADLVITPIGRYVAGRASVPNAIQWTVVEKKLQLRGGSYVNWGLVVRP